MAVYFVTGTLGCGKTLCTVGKIRDYIQQGRRVATNLDINLPELTKPDSKYSLIRVPDKPSVTDLECIGIGSPTNDESTFGLLVLDELGTWFNSREWREKGRAEVIEWFRHARKLHWDIYLIVQDIESLDGQLVRSLCEHLVICKRTDRIPIPLVAPVLKTVGLAAVLPKIHIAKVYYGKNESAMSVGRWWYRGKDLYSAYNTDQVFSDESCGIHSVLPAYYQNNIALINEYQGKIKALTPQIEQTKSNLSITSKYSLALIVFVFMGLMGFRTYSKIQHFDKPEIIQVENKVNEPPPQITQTLPIVNNPYQSPKEIDYIQQVTQGKQIIATSYYSANGKINAILHIENDENDMSTTFTLEDARSLGYVVILHGNIIEVRKNGYYFTFNAIT